MMFATHLKSFDFKKPAIAALRSERARSVNEGAPVANPDSEVPPKSDAAKLPRSLSRSQATIILENDPMRTGTPANIYELATGRLGLQTEYPPDLNEMLKVRLKNDIQKIERLVRGIVREVTQVGDGLYRVQIELFARLTPLDVLLLKATFADDTQEDGTVWI